MKKIFITDYPVVDRIIRHLKLSFQAERPPPPQIAQQELLMAAEESEEYFWGALKARLYEWIIDAVYLVENAFSFMMHFFTLSFLLTASFSYDMFIPACQKVKITENRERFVASTKRKFL